MVLEETDWTGRTLGNYQVLRKLGAGGMATVYKAHEMSLNRIVALKVISRQLSEDASFIERFKREAQAAAQINHANIVQIYAIGQEDDIHFFAMEYVKGESLQEVIRREGFLTAARSVPIVRQTAEALSVAHEAGIVHRDIKPANIMIDAAGRAKVADFGIAQMDTRTRLTNAGLLVGTPEYISPEQCRGEKLDGRSDIYSLGVTFYQMLGGTSPFEADTPAALVLQIIEGNFAPIQQVNPMVPPHVQRLLSRMMQPDQNKRFQSAEDLVAAIRDIEAVPSRLVPAPAMATAPAAPAEATEVAGEGAPPAQTAAPPVAALPAAEPVAATVVMNDAPAPPAPAAPVAEKAPPVPSAAPARGNRNLVIGIAAVLIVAIGAIAAWQLLGRGGTEEAANPTAAEESASDPSQADAGVVAEQGKAAAGETGAEVGGEEATEGAEPPGADTPDPAARIEEPAAAAANPAAQVQEPAAAAADPGTAGTGETPQTESPAPVVRQPPAEPTAPSATQREAAEAETERAPAFIPPPVNSVVTTIEGDYEYLESVIAWTEQVFGREGFLVIDGPSSPARSMQEVARFHIVLSARLQGTDQLEYFGRVQTQYTVALTARAIFLGNGAVFAGPRTETVRYTSVNAEQNLQEATTKLARDLSRELRDKAGLGR